MSQSGLEKIRSQSAPPARPQRPIIQLGAAMSKKYQKYHPQANLDTCKSLIQGQITMNLVFKQAPWRLMSQSYVQANDTAGWMEIEDFMKMIHIPAKKIQIHKWRDTKKLELVARNIGISNDQLGKLGVILGKYFPTLQSLTLDFGWSLHINDAGLANLVEAFAPNLLNLTHLSLSFPECKKITDNGMKILANQLGKYSLNLKSLVLNFSKCARITQKGFNDLSLVISKKLLKLRDLDLNFSYDVKVEENALGALGAHFGKSHLKNLKFLSIAFSGCHAMTDSGMESFTKNLGDGLVNLKKLDINFADCSLLADKGLKAITSLIVDQCKGLKELDLNFSGQEVTNAGLVFFGKKMHSISNRIKILKLDFSNNRHVAPLCKKETRIFLKAVPTVIIR